MYEPLQFELVDYIIDYSGFKNRVIYYEAGRRENSSIALVLEFII